MKRTVFIGLLLLLALASCHGPFGARSNASSDTVVSPEPQSPQRSQLLAIDSLAWLQPDSALALLLPWFDTVDSSQAFDNHYAHLLLAELLYKNEYAQTNRDEVQQAVDYFDSLADTPTAAFLAARAHYINGVGHYEQESVEEACNEYINALETMERHFDERELVGKRARFMAYTYNRLGDMFSEQFMMDPAIYCYRNSYAFSRITPNSPYSVASALYRIGKQFDKKKEMDSADYYYSSAIANMPDTSNLLYRDMVSSQSLMYYQMKHQAVWVLQRLKQMACLTDDFGEKTTRFLVIGHIYFEERMYDSAEVYLKASFENKADVVTKMQVADYLRILYDTLGNRGESDYYMRFLALHNPMSHDTNAATSSLGELFKNHLAEKQRRRAEKEKHDARRLAVKRTIGILVSVSMAIVTSLVILISSRHRKQIAAKEEGTKTRIHEQGQRHAAFLESERQKHRMVLSSLSGRLRRKNQEVRELKERIRWLDNMPNPTQQEAASFADEPICRLILERVEEGKFLSQMDCSIYKQYALSKDDMFALREACNRHFNQFSLRLGRDYPKLSSTDINYCCLYLLNLSDADVSALMQRAYNTVNERNNKLRKIFDSKAPLFVTLQTIASGYISR